MAFWVIRIDIQRRIERHKFIEKGKKNDKDNEENNNSRDSTRKFRICR